MHLKLFCNTVRITYTVKGLLLHNIDAKNLNPSNSPPVWIISFGFWLHYCKSCIKVIAFPNFMKLNLHLWYYLWSAFSQQQTFSVLTYCNCLSIQYCQLSNEASQSLNQLQKSKAHDLNLVIPYFSCRLQQCFSISFTKKRALQERRKHKVKLLQWHGSGILQQLQDMVFPLRDLLEISLQV